MTDEDLESISGLAEVYVEQLYSNFVQYCLDHANSRNSYYRDIFLDFMKERLDEPDFMYRIGKLNE